MSKDNVLEEIMKKDEAQSCALFSTGGANYRGYGDLVEKTILSPMLWSSAKAMALEKEEKFESTVIQTDRSVLIISETNSGELLAVLYEKKSDNNDIKYFANMNLAYAEKIV